MLEVRNVTKIYEQKFGPQVRALDNVSIRFPERGMVFLLGKSGSGKSTLLNICGGLDAPTTGEIIVKGRSSGDFFQSDFDSYRNTYVGFVFQEYNILNEFTVEDNISLALELQGKPKDKAAVEALLAQVDMQDYARRKPNTLSGGQKQRIAIARALVKQPEIIMADEPTGALDSNTGRQVFETLKKLSADKLVVVVSHDRDFAERYGDRIIELADGHILSDVTKVRQPQQTLSERVSVAGNLLRIQGGTALSDGDFDRIRDFLRQEEGEVLIAAGEPDVQTVKKATRLNEDGQREVFQQTPPERNAEAVPDTAKFIRSRLPLRHAARIGVSSMKAKPVRLIFTILLCVVAFTIFGMLSTMSLYNNEATFKQSLMDSDLQMLRVEKQYKITQRWYQDGKLWDTESQVDNTSRFSPAELEKLTNTYGEDTFGGVSVSSTINLRSQGGYYWSGALSTMAVLPENHQLRGKINGTYPEKAGEICISSYTAEALFQCGIVDENGKGVELKNAEDLIGRNITIDGTAWKITGIFDSGSLPAKYDVLKDGDEVNWQLYNQFRTALTEGLHRTAFVSEDAIGDISNENVYSYDYGLWYRWAYVADDGGLGNGFTLPEYSNYVYKEASKCNGMVYALSEEEGAMLPAGYFYALVQDYYAEHTEDAKLLKACRTLAEEAGIFSRDDRYAQERELVLEALKRDGVQFQISVTLSDEENATTMGESREFAVVGFWEPYTMNTDTNVVYLPDETAQAMWQEQRNSLNWYEEYSTAYVEDPEAVYSVVYLPYDHSQKRTEQFWSMYRDKSYASDDSRIRLSSSFVENLEMIDEVIEVLEKVFLYGGLALAVFAALLLSNFISVSVANKKREIGILRAVGARSGDVFKIFFSESFVIASICVVLSTLVSVLLCNTVNGLLSETIGASLFVFGVGSFALVLGIAAVTAVVATFLPVWHAARKKPVDSIRSL